MVDYAHCVIFLQFVLHTLSNQSRRAMSREQRANLKFHAKLGKTPSESFAMLKKHVYGNKSMGKKQCHVHVHLNGTRGSKRDERRVKMIHGLEDLQRAERRTTSSV